MRVLVLGAAGMMGHMACRVLSEHHEVVGTVRGSWDPSAPMAGLVGDARVVDGVDVLDQRQVADVVSDVAPEAVVNCVGIVKQLDAAKDAIASIECNSLLPHRLAALSSEAGARFVHLSTDCVFSGRRGGYSEDDIPDPVDLYGRSKLLGETGEGEGLTIRTSIVGRQLTGRTSFFEWILANRGREVRGFDRAVYSGLTTAALARIVDEVLTDHPDLTGVWQIASEPITKYEIIVRLDQLLGLDLTIVRDTDFACDRSLDGRRFAERTGIVVPTWTEMLEEFAADGTAYAGLREVGR